MDFERMLVQLTGGFGRTCMIFVLTLLFSLPLGMLVYFAKRIGLSSKRQESTRRVRTQLWDGICALVRLFISLYISIMRGTPLMLQLLIWYFAPYYLWGMQIGNSYKLVAIIVGFSLNYGAYFAEIYRSGMEAIPKGQYEAAAVLGYTKGQTFFRIILPQVVKIVLPSVTNEVITLVKDTSLVYALSYVEMFALAKQIAASQTTLLPFVIAGVFYYIFNFLVAWGMNLLEKRFSYYQ